MGIQASTTEEPEPEAISIAADGGLNWRRAVLCGAGHTELGAQAGELDVMQLRACLLDIVNVAMDAGLRVGVRQRQQGGSLTQRWTDSPPGTRAAAAGAMS
jgi:hypothetical protein